MRSDRLLIILLSCIVSIFSFILKPTLLRTRVLAGYKKMSEYAEKDYTLIFCRRTNEYGIGEILLGMKKRGFGFGKWNGFGGKIEHGESIDEGAKRELMEECSITANSLERRGFLVFKMIESRKIMRVHVFDTEDYSGEPIESEEMVIFLSFYINGY